MKSVLFFIFGLFITSNIEAQVLELPEVIQEETEWCWAGVSKSILDYYGSSLSQCEIAEYARQVATWHDFGDTACCDNPDLGCNYWNYNWGVDGSIQDILIYFESIQNYGYGNALTIDEILSEMTAGRPFIVRWGWDSGGGHFVVGHGINENNISYMNPWFGEGYHISSYDWLVSGGNHTWTHTNILTTSLETDDLILKDNLSLFPNPVESSLHIVSNRLMKAIAIYSSTGELIQNNLLNEYSVSIDTSQFPTGIYIIRINQAKDIVFKKFIKG